MQVRQNVWLQVVVTTGFKNGELAEFQPVFAETASGMMTAPSNDSLAYTTYLLHPMSSELL